MEDKILDSAQVEVQEKFSDATKDTEISGFHFESLSRKEKLDLMFNCGMHYPHRRSHPSFSHFLSESKRGIQLSLSLHLFEEGLARVKKIFSSGGNALFVGTKTQIVDIVEREAKRCMQYWVTKKWIGGMLTNTSYTVHESLRRLDSLSSKMDDSMLYTKKETIVFGRQHAKIFSRLRGIGGDKEQNKRGLGRHPPKLVVIVDPAKEFTAVREVLSLRRRAFRSSTSMIILGDGFGSKFDLKMLGPQDIFVPGNDDGSMSVELFCVAIADAVLDGLQLMTDKNELKREVTREETVEEES